MNILLAVLWTLYFWSDTHGVDKNAGTFISASDASVFVLNNCQVPAEGIKFCIHNDDWSVQYGWSDEGGAVNTTGVAVKLATATQANGWLDLPAGTYDVTFNSSALTIRFDTVAEAPELESFLRGGDLTMATYIEDWGAKFYYHDGTQGDLFDILKAYGVNLARLRLYHSPGAAVQMWNSETTKYDTYRMPVQSPANGWTGAEYAGEADILNLAKRAKEHGMAICLTIYLSDYWSGATEQFIPAAWSNANTLELLGDSVYNYVTRIMTKMKNQGTEPQYVSVGNESNYGILYNKSKNSTFVDYGGHTTRNGISNTVYLFNRAYAAIKGVCPESQVIIHHSYGDAANISACSGFFQELKDNGCNFDIVGGSYYPYWATEHGALDATPTGMLAWAAEMETSIGKPVMIMEVGYSWDPYKCPERNGGNWPGQLGLNGAYNEASEDGQAAFMKELHEAIETDKNIVGYMYWDPIFVDQLYPGSDWWIKTCWAEKYSSDDGKWYENGNVISNTTWFDYEGMPLKALWSEVASYVPDPGEATGVDSEELRVKSEKCILNGQLLIERGGKTYTLTGQELR